MRYPSGHELPPEQEQANRRALRIEWISIGYWISVITLLYFVLGSSQAMKAAWVEDILALFPPVVFLIASRFRHREPSNKFAWGYHRAITLAYLVATVALFILGLYILLESVDKLLSGVHPAIGMVEIFEWQVWLGWVMLAALAYSVVPPVILGRLKQPLSETLHDKVLLADARMNRADWLTAVAAMGGIIGIGLGLWWADAVAAIAISLDILWDGQKYLRGAVADLMDDEPKTPDESQRLPLVDQLRSEVAAVPWIREAAVRMRENGHLVSGDVWVVPTRDDAGLAARCEALGRRLTELDWRVLSMVVAPVSSLEQVPEGVHVRGAGHKVVE